MRHQYISNHRRTDLHPRGGFTLVEMLVSAALIMIVMLMFAQVYQVAGESVGKQKGIAENDQRSRTLTTIINNDFNSRTFRKMVPMHPAELPPIADPTLRVGYFYISENDPLNDADDVVQFSIETSTDDPELSGRALKLSEAPLSLAPPTSEELNQPEADDGQIDLSANPVINNRTGSSRYAEVSYFLRPNGNLIRRVLLIRKQYSDVPPSVPPGDAQPPSFPVADYPAGFSFWNDFDYSASYLAGSGPQFHDAGISGGDFDNDDLSAGTSFGRPHFRFGHDLTTGNPREYANQPATLYIGRFTQQETSHPDFDYPGRLPDIDNDGTPDYYPFDPAAPLGFFNGVVSYQAGVDGNWGSKDDVQFTGLRRSDDILMTNVHAFDVKVFDEIYDETAANADLNHDGRLNIAAEGGAFADLGHGATGDYAQANNAMPTYGSHPVVVGDPIPNNIFDTWHHQVDIDNSDGDGMHSTGQDPPPFWPNSTGGIANPTTPGAIARPLRAVQVTIRFFDVASGQMRQLTLIESLNDAD